MIDAAGARLWEETCRSTPEAIAGVMRKRAPTATRVGMETGTAGSVALARSEAAEAHSDPGVSFGAVRLAGSLRSCLPRTSAIVSGRARRSQRPFRMPTICVFSVKSDFR